MFISIDFWSMASSLAAVSGVIISAVTFWKSFARMKESEQIKIANDVENRLTESENRILEAKKNNDVEDIKDRYIQYLNVWEFFSLLIKDKRITMSSLMNYYKPTMLEDYKEIFDYYPELKQDDSRFKEFKTLCEEWENTKNISN